MNAVTSERSFEDLSQFRLGFAQLIDSLAANGQRGLSRQLAELAVQYGIWNEPMQRPHLHFVRSIRGAPLPDMSDRWFVPYLEQNFAGILREIEAIGDPQEHGFTPVDGPYEPFLYRGGKWEHAILYHDGVRLNETCKLFPFTSALVDSIPEVTTQAWGLVYFSWLYPGTHIKAHCGPSNGRLRLHLGVKVPSGVKMRVGDAEFVWRPGKCVVIDDSYEHEVWHNGTGPRVVLILDFLHPELSESERGKVLNTMRPNEEDKILEFLIENQLSRLSLGADGEIVAHPTRAVVAEIRRKMQELGLQAVRNDNGRLVTERSK